MIYIDVSPAVHSRAGLGRYAEKLALEVSKQQDVALFHNLGADGKMPPQLAHLPAVSVRAGYKLWRLAVFGAQVLPGRPFTWDRRLPNASLFHATEHLLVPFRNIPTILTIHDIIPHLFPQYHKRLNYWFLRFAMPLFCRRATAIITVSEASKQDIVQHFGTDAEKITVIPEAAADHFAPPSAADIDRVRQKYDLPDDYLIHIGTIEPRKNLDRLVDCLLTLRKQAFPDLTLILVGSKGWLMEDFYERLEREGLSEIVRSPGWVEDEDLPGLIGGARLGVQPSLYEGFGLPVLELMACGQVVATSSRSSLPEVGGEAAIYFDPENTADMTTTIHQILSNPTEYAERQKLGLAQAAKFSWEKAAAETIALYDQVREKYAKRS